MEGSFFDNIPPDKLRQIKQNMIEYLRRECPQIYGGLKDEPLNEEQCF